MVQLVTDIEPENQLSLRTKEYHMPYVNVHGVNLYYEEYGKGPAVILTPGGRVDRNGLRPMAALLSPVWVGAASAVASVAPDCTR